jgi:4-hydroxyphenylacetate 3-monooxygenase
MKLRTGAEYRESLRDGRKVWVMGEGLIDDLTTHPATRGMVESYVEWYDRHFDPDYQDVLLTPPDASGIRRPVQFLLPMSADDLTAMGKAYEAIIFPTAGNLTHDAAYGNVITMTIVDAVQRMKVSQKQVDDIFAYRKLIQDEGRFMTYASGNATIGYRYREDPKERRALRIVEERDDGLVVTGKLGMHTSPPFADDIYIGPMTGLIYNDLKAGIIVPTNAPGVTVVARKIAARHANPFIAPLSHRFDELDGQLWLDDVFVPWERIFLMDPMDEEGEEPRPPAKDSTTWLLWHQLYCWYAKGEYTLGLALALADVMGLKQHQPTLEYINDMIVAVQTVRSCLTAAERDPVVSVAGYVAPNYAHVASGSIAMLNARQRLTEILRILPGSSLVVAPSDEDLADPEMKAGLEESFGGGGYTALQRSALLNLAWDHISSGLDGRESAFELHCNGGVPSWRNWARVKFGDYNRLANGVLEALSVEMPQLDLTSMGEPRRMRRREVRAPRPEAEATTDGAAPADGSGAPAGTNGAVPAAKASAASS